MECVEQRENDIIILQIKGKLDSFTSKSFEERLLNLIEQGFYKFIIDGSELEYVSSAGLRVFYLASNRLEKNQGKIVFCSIKPNIQRVFDIVDLSSEFRILSTREEAQKEF